MFDFSKYTITKNTITKKQKSTLKGIQNSVFDWLYFLMENIIFHPSSYFWDFWLTIFSREYISKFDHMIIFSSKIFSLWGWFLFSRQFTLLKNLTLLKIQFFLGWKSSQSNTLKLKGDFDFGLRFGGCGVDEEYIILFYSFFIFDLIIFII